MLNMILLAGAMCAGISLTGIYSNESTQVANATLSIIAKCVSHRHEMSGDMRFPTMWHV